MDAVGETRPAMTAEVRPGVVVCPDAAAVAREAAARFVRLAREPVAQRGRFSVALAGGSTPRELYRLLAGDAFRAQVDWQRVRFFWGDERPVPPSHPESNFGMAWRELLSRLSLPAENIHRMEAERADMEAAAREYENVLRRELALDEQGFPRFDLVLLGLGADGHTASLFPEAREALQEAARWVVAPRVAQAGGRRMTLTLPVLNAAVNVVFLVAGSEKAAALRRVLDGGGEPLPAQLVRPVGGRRVFLVDASAAELLRERERR
jgi:6-phosphogluconolactonase